MTDCAYARSNMTPCVLRDGYLAVGFASRGRPLCVGCERWESLPLGEDVLAAMALKAREPDVTKED